MNTSDLHLVLSGYWYREILNGTKRVEYRNICPYWEERIWNKRSEIKSVIFHDGYTSKKIRFAVEKIDIGECPYKGWRGLYYRIFFK